MGSQEGEFCTGQILNVNIELNRELFRVLFQVSLVGSPRIVLSQSVLPPCSRKGTWPGIVCRMLLLSFGFVLSLLPRISTGDATHSTAIISRMEAIPQLPIVRKESLSSNHGP